MLTIEEIKNISFRKASLGGGYKAEDVDAFIDEVIVTFEHLKKEITTLVHKKDRLATRIEEYKSNEETVRNALLTSQKMSDACIKEAKDKAAKIIREAETKAQLISVEANRRTSTEKQNYLSLQADAVNLRNELIELYKKHIKAIDDLPTAADLEQNAVELDSKYPTDSITADAVQPEPAEASENISSSSPQEAAANPVSNKGQKFSHLKFGDNYDVSED